MENENKLTETEIENEEEESEEVESDKDENEIVHFEEIADNADIKEVKEDGQDQKKVKENEENIPDLPANDNEKENNLTEENIIGGKFTGKIETEGMNDDIGDEDEPVQKKKNQNENYVNNNKPEESYFNMEEMSEFNVELRNNNDFINMSHFDEASKAGFAINYDIGESNPNQHGSLHQRYNPQFEKMISHIQMSPTTMNLNLQSELEKLNLDAESFSPNNLNTNRLLLKRLGTEGTIKIIENQELELNSPIVQPRENKKNEPVKVEHLKEKNSKQSSKKDVSKIHESNKNVNKSLYSRSETENSVNLTDEELLKKFKQIKNTSTFKKYILNNHPNSYPIQPQQENPIPENKSDKLKNIISIEKTISKINQLGLNNIIDPAKSQIVKGTSNLTHSTPVDNINSKNLKEKIKSKDDLIKSLNEEIKSLKATIGNYKDNLIEAETKLEVKNKECSELKEKFENISFEFDIVQNKLNEYTQINSKLSSDLADREGQIERANIDLNQKDELLSKYFNENESLKNQMENMKMEVNIQRNEILKKNDKIVEMQQKNFALEQELNDVKSRSTNEINNLRESKQNLEALKSNYYEIKNQYELLNMKHQTLSDENFNVKRDLLLYEKEIKNKNEIIERLRKEIIETNKKNFLSSDGASGSGSNLNLNLNLNNILKGGDNYDNYEYKNNYNTNFTQNNLRTKGLSKKDQYEKNLEEFNKTLNTGTMTAGNKKNNKEEDDPLASSMPNILPSQKGNLEREKKIRAVEVQLYSMNRERDLMQAELNRLPQHPKKREQIVKRKELEDKIDSYSKDLAKLKQELRELNAINRDY